MQQAGKTGLTGLRLRNVAEAFGISVQTLVINNIIIPMANQKVHGGRSVARPRSLRRVLTE